MLLSSNPSYQLHMMLNMILTRILSIDELSVQWSKLSDAPCIWTELCLWTRPHDRALRTCQQGEDSAETLGMQNRHFECRIIAKSARKCFFFQSLISPLHCRMFLLAPVQLVIHWQHVSPNRHHYHHHYYHHHYHHHHLAAERKCSEYFSKPLVSGKV